MSNAAVTWTVDPDDPRAPPTAIWEQLSPEQRDAVVAALPSEFPASEAQPPEGDDHLDAFSGARSALRRWFRQRGRRIYVAGNLPIYYPGERMFSPDLVAVDGATQRQRDSWVVDREAGKGLDVAIEIVVRGDRKKDLERNVARYARLGIPEYYLFDRRRLTLAAWELEGDRYRRRMPQGGRYGSAVLGLDLWLDGERLRFSVGEAPVPYVDELLARVERLSTEAQDRVDELEAELAAAQARAVQEQARAAHEQARAAQEQARAAQEQARAEHEQARAESAEARAAALQAELDAMKQKG